MLSLSCHSKGQSRDLKEVPFAELPALGGCSHSPFPAAGGSVHRPDVQGKSAFSMGFSVTMPAPEVQMGSQWSVVGRVLYWSWVAEMRPHTAALDSIFPPLNLDDGLDDLL